MRISDWSSDVCSSDLGARERFLSDLVWGSKGLGGFNRGDLAEDLGDDQIRDVLGLFGSDMVAYAPPSRAAGIGIDRTGLTGISDLERRYTRFYHDANDAYASGDDATRSKTIAARFDALFPAGSEERRVGKECVSTFRSRWSPDQ